MSAIDALLGPRRHSHSPAAIGPDPYAGFARTFLFADTEVHLQEDAAAEEIIVFSFPGVMSDAAWLAGRPQPWRCRLPHPVYAAVHCVLSVHPDDGRVCLADVCDRTALDVTTLEAFLNDHVTRHHEWRALLAAAPSDVAREPDFVTSLQNPDRLS